MKKLSSVIIALFLATVLLFSIAGCSSDKQSKIDGLQSQIEQMEAKLAEKDEQIRELNEKDELQILIKQLKDQLTEIEGKLTETKTKLAEMEKQISELNERINQLEKELYSDKIYSLQEAYDNGWLTQDDVMSIAYYHSSRAYNEEIMPEDYEPMPKTPEVLSEETELKIKTAYAKYYNEIYNDFNEIYNEYKTAEEIYISKYYGTYNGCVAVIVDHKNANYIDFFSPESIVIGNVAFLHNRVGPPFILVYKL